MSFLSPEPTQPELSGLVTIQGSGAWLASGINFIGADQVSGAVQVSGGVTISGGVTVSGTVSVSGLFAGSSGGMKFMSGVQAFSGAIPVIPLIYDYSGAQWVAASTAASGQLTQAINITDPGIPHVAAGVFASVDNASQFTNALTVWNQQSIFDQTTLTWGRSRSTTSGDAFRLRVSAEGQAPTYSVNVYNKGLISGTAGAANVGPLLALMNLGSGTAIQSGSAYKIKGLYIYGDPANLITSGSPVKFDIIRMTAFSGVGAGSTLSGTAHDKADPAYSGTLAAPVLGTFCTSGYTLDAYYFSYITNNAGPWANFSFQYANPDQQQTNNLIASRLADTKEIIIRSGYGFAVVQSSGAGYTQVFSGTFNYQLIYSVEGMTYVGP